MSVPASVAQLAELGEETWGEKLARARMGSHVGLRGAATLISETVMPTSFATLSRLEGLIEPPAELRRRILATLAVIAYGYAPASFGLSIDDIPRSVDLEAFIARTRASARAQSSPQGACLTADDLQRVA